MLIRLHSPNFNERPNSVINAIVIHSTHLSFKESLARLTNTEAKVSCHYLINTNGDIYQLVKDQDRAWHAGISHWRGQEGLNDTSIGIELVDTNSRGMRLKHFPLAQMQALIPLLQRLIKKYKISKHNVVAHSDIAPDRKDDPGEHFSWKKLAAHGIGAYHDVKIEPRKIPTPIKSMQALFKKYGYKIKLTGKFDKQTKEVLMAFRRHFNPKLIRKRHFSVADYEILTSLTHEL